MALSALSDLSARRAAEWQSLLLGTVNRAAAATVRGRGASSSAEAEGASAASASGDGAFAAVASETMVGLHIVVLAKRSLLPDIGGVQTAQVATGVLGIMGNKGGVSVRVRVRDTSLCFVCAHLAAHRSAVAARNADYSAIMGRLSFPAPVEDADVDTAVAAAAAGRPAAAVAALLRPSGSEAEAGRSLSRGGTLRADDNDVVVFFGDLNYRVGDGVSVEEALDHAKAGRIEPLIDRDQLTRERVSANSFHGFDEAQIVFPPTYKYRPGTDAYDDRPDKKPRAPAWCDRVLWRVHRTRDPGSVRALLYAASSECMSDHKPVHALVELDARVVLPRQRDRVRAEVLAEADRMENDSVPRVTLSTKAVDFGRVAYRRPASLRLTILNDGRSPAAWRFVPKPGDASPSQPWLTVSPAAGYLPPGAECAVTLVASAGVTEARAAAAGSPSLDDTLVLRVEAGSDEYVTVGASMRGSAFGCSVAQMARMHAPAAEHVMTSDGPLPPAHWAAQRAGDDAADATAARPGKGSLGPDPGAASASASAPMAGRPSPVEVVGPPASAGAAPLPAPLPVPKELWLLGDRLLRPAGGAGLRAAGLFIAPGDVAGTALCRECVDGSRRLPDDASSPLAAAATLLELLASMREPLVPPSLLPGRELVASSPASARSWCAAMLALLPACNYNALVYVLSLAREALAPANAEHNGLTPALLAAALGPALFRGAMAGHRELGAALGEEGPAHPAVVLDAATVRDPTATRVFAATVELLTAPSLRM